MKIAAACLLLALPASAARIETYAGNGRKGGQDGPRLEASLDDPFGCVRGPDDALYVCEFGGHRVRRIDPDGRVTTLAGTGEAGYSGDAGPALEARLNKPHELRIGPDGALYVSDSFNHVIRRIDLDRAVISTVAGNGERGFAGDGGPATAASLDRPHSFEFGPDGTLYIADVGNHRIRAVDPDDGTIRTLAGTGAKAPTPDGARFATAPLHGPRAIDIDRHGRLWVALREGNQVHRLDLDAGTIHHLAGTGAKGYSGDGGPAREATLDGPKGIMIDAAGDAWVVDTENHAIRVIRAADGTIETLVGTGTAGDGPDGDPRLCRLARPHGVLLDPAGVFIADSENHVVRRLLAE